MQIEEHISLKGFHTFGVEAYARYFCRIQNLGELQQILKNQKMMTMPRILLGKGSDILFTKDFDGLVLKDELKGIELVHENEDSVWIKAASGEKWHDFVAYCVSQNWGGIENLALIPGTVGASPVQNIGAYGAELKDSMHSLEAVDLQTGKSLILMNNECQFSYRWSIFKEKEKRNKYYITSVTFRLKKNPQPNISYADLQAEMHDKEVTIQNIFNAVVAVRKRKLPDPADFGNAGSFFKNPVVDMKHYETLLQQFPDLKSFPHEQGIKLAAAQLIDLCGWKGIIEKQVGVYKNQALVIVNFGGASGKDILDFSKKIQDSVYRKFGVKLETEVNIL